MCRRAVRPASALALIGNQVDFVSEVSVWAPYVESGQARLLVLNTPKRAAGYPNVPTYAELGYDYLRSVQAIIGPAGIPEDIRQKLETAFRAALQDPGFKRTMDDLKMEIIDRSGQQTRDIVVEETAKVKRLHRRNRHEMRAMRRGTIRGAPLFAAGRSEISHADEYAAPVRPDAARRSRRRRRNLARERHLFERLLADEPVDPARARRTTCLFQAKAAVRRASSPAPGWST